jgi:hypothetical protein
MTTSTLLASSQQIFGEIFPIAMGKDLNCTTFRVPSVVSKEAGNRIAYHLTRHVPEIAVVWADSIFWGFSSKVELPNRSKWQEMVDSVRQQLDDEYGDALWNVEMVPLPPVGSKVISRLAVTVLDAFRPFASCQVLLKSGVEVRRVTKYGDEEVLLEEQLVAALSMGLHHRFQWADNLSTYWSSLESSTRTSPEEVLVGMTVSTLEQSSSATIVSVVGKVSDHRERLMARATGAISQLALEEADDDEPVVAVQFGQRTGREYHYALAALRPQITASSSWRFGVDYGELLSATKISHQERSQHITDAKAAAAKALSFFSLGLGKSFNTRNTSQLFWRPDIDLDCTPLLFGKGVTSDRSHILDGLKRGGTFAVPPAAIGPARIIAVKLCDGSVQRFVEECISRLAAYGQQAIIVDKVPIAVTSLANASARATLERAMDTVLAVPSDAVLIFLPQSDREADDTEHGSLYHHLYRRTAGQGRASQFVYSDTLQANESRHILNQVVPGLLAKLGHTPFVLAEPLTIADYYIGFDISRSLRSRGAGSRNAFGSVCLFGSRGEFVRPISADFQLDGEEIPAPLLERLLPAADLSNKRVLLMRDGPFRGNEAAALVNRAKAIGSEFVLVEVIKSGVPRLYGVQNTRIMAPPRGQAMLLSHREAILVTTTVSEKVGLAQPLRVRVRSEGAGVDLPHLLETLLKLTLLHHGSLRTPRLPMPLFAADKIAYLNLRGITSAGLSSPCQSWL